MVKLFAAILAACAVLVIGSGCSDTATNSASQNATPTVTVAASLALQLVNSSVVVGSNRLQFAIVDETGAPQSGMSGKVSLYQLQGTTGTLKSEHDLLPVTVALSAASPTTQGHTEQHFGGDAITVYVANADLDVAGPWGAEVSLQRSGRPLEALQLAFLVQADAAFPQIGDAAPPSKNPVLRDVTNISELDTSKLPDPEMHQLTIADALQTGKPTVIAFMTPGFCTSRLCGPVLEQVVVPLQQQFKDRVQFIHIEPYSLKEARAEGKLIPVPSVQQWGLETEPWLFIADKNGRIAASFEGIVSLAEARAVLEQVTN